MKDNAHLKKIKFYFSQKENRIRENPTWRWICPIVSPLTTAKKARPFQNYINLRNHRKIFLFDGKTVLAGGMNLSREYMGPPPVMTVGRISFFQSRGLRFSTTEKFSPKTGTTPPKKN